MPLLHAKLMLLGELTWMEDEEFGLGDITRFRPGKLWIGSANGTFSSRFNLEIGCWQTQPELLSSAQDFLARIPANSEDLDPDADTMEPELAGPVYDDAAMADPPVHHLAQQPRLRRKAPPHRCQCKRSLMRH